MITLTCSQCSTEYTTTKGNYKVALWRGQTKFYCSPKCVGLSQRVTAVTMVCDECGKSFDRQASANKVSKSGLRFCGRQCAIVSRGRRCKIANASQPKPPRVQSPGVVCRRCKGPRVQTASGRWRCPKCALNVGPPVGPRTKGDLFASRANWQSARSSIQTSARRIFLRANPQPSCGAIEVYGQCGYSKHVEVAHRRDVADFPDSALISEINDLSNLVALCPTHHWEFDHSQFDGVL